MSGLRFMTQICASISNKFVKVSESKCSLSVSVVKDSNLLTYKVGMVLTCTSYLPTERSAQKNNTQNSFHMFPLQKKCTLKGVNKVASDNCFIREV